MLYCFLDTNILLEFKTFDEIDWQNELETSEVTLVVPLTVIRELDKIKGDSKYERKRNRARMIIKKIENLVKSTKAVSIRPGLYLLVVEIPTSDSLRELRYNPDIPDDQIVGAAHLFMQQHSNEDVVV